MTPLHLLLALVAMTVGLIISIWRYKTLNCVPGPLLASVTPLWRVYHAYFSRDRVIELELHERYGPIVRTAPRVLSFSDPEIMRDVYIKGFHKIQSMLLKNRIRADWSTVRRVHCSCTFTKRERCIQHLLRS